MLVSLTKQTTSKQHLVISQPFSAKKNDYKHLKRTLKLKPSLLPRVNTTFGGNIFLLGVILNLTYKHEI